MSSDDEFVRESREQLRRLTNGFVDVERGAHDDDLIDSLFRTAHTLKGSCGMVGLADASRLAHAIEDLLSELRQQSGTPSPAVIDAALGAVDDIDTLLDDHRIEGESTVDVDGSIETLRRQLATYTSNRRSDQPARQREVAMDDVDTLDGEDVEEAVDTTGEEGRDDEDAGNDEDAGDGDDAATFDDAVEQALNAASEFDDLDELLAEGDDDGSDLSSWGTFDHDEGELSTIEPSAAMDESAAAMDEPPEAMDEFQFIKEEIGAQSETEGEDLAELQRDIDAVEFGEFDDDDELTIEDLIDGAPSDLEWAADEAQVEALQRESKGDERSRAEERSEGERVTEPRQTDTESTVGADESVTEANGAPSLATGGEGSVQPTSHDVSDGLSDAGTVEADSPADAPMADGTEVDNGTTDHRFSFDLGSDDSRAETAVDWDGDGPAEDVLADFDDLELTDDPELTDDSNVLEPTDVKSASVDDSTFVRDESTAEFESRFTSRFDDPEDREKAKAALVQRAATTIEESTLDAARFAGESGIEDGAWIDDRAPTDPSDGAVRVESISVDIENADTLLDLVDELAVVGITLRERAGGNDLDESLSALDAVTAELRRSVTELRLMPLSSVVEGLHRVVRDVARVQDKRVSFAVDDEGVHLDRSIIDRIGDPLVHLVRNAVDHGIEASDERIRNGKPREGQIELRARRDRATVVIEVEDDGRGIDPETVRKRAIEAGIVTEAETKQMPLVEMYDLVFESGLSTASEVTDVSGRGVGMDVVERTITALDGTIELDSEPGGGTTVSLRVPVSVAITELLFVTVGEERFAIPVPNVDGVNRLDGQSVVWGSELVAEGGELVVEDDELVVERVETDDEPDRFPLVDLGESLSVPGSDRGERNVVVRTSADGRVCCLLCDEVEEPREAVVKPYESLLGNIAGVSGATMLGNGELANVIDIGSL